MFKFFYFLKADGPWVFGQLQVSHQRKKISNQNWKEHQFSIPQNILKTLMLNISEEKFREQRQKPSDFRKSVKKWTL